MNFQVLLAIDTLYFLVYTFALTCLCYGYLIYTYHISKRKFSIEKLEWWERNAKLPFRTWYMLFSDADYSGLAYCVVNSRPISFVPYILFGVLLMLICLYLIILNLLGGNQIENNIILVSLSIFGLLRTFYLLRFKNF